MEKTKVVRRRAPGGGRKPQGVTRKVSLTLTEAEWATLEASAGTVAAYIKQQLAAVPAAPVPEPAHSRSHSVLPADNPAAERAPRVPVALDRRRVSEAIQMAASAAKRAGAPVPDEDVAAAEQQLLELLYPKSAEHAQLAVLHQYVCPATGKRFGSADKLLRALAPQALQWPANERARKRVNQLAGQLSQARKETMTIGQIR
ncbi:hypothetical protein HGI30_16660 [Paenibacillus albicereus]|uniref:Uncharacterized protein n=1 Tax=Paenibacillus albicereus TaxID=2726185 RepID=A0A6H2H030_9BACL|nr:hypothetical protein [Paenibacillus albicereus]QJC53043.1 hypothetical protein HGI30_16660 [Paenibacillus albicereus]